jgi:hypothetical protein
VLFYLESEGHIGGNAVMRVNVRKSLMAAVMCGMLMWMACSTAWVSEAEQILAALIPGIANAVTLAAMFQGDVSGADLRAVQRAGSEAGATVQSIQSLITQYQKADAAAQPGLLNKIQAALTSVQATLNGLLPALHIKDAATEAKIAAVVGILLAEVESVAAIVPLLSPGASPGIRTMAARRVQRRPPPSATEFVAAYNAAMTAKTGKQELDHATAGLRIHRHGEFARWASAGLLK